MGFYWTGRARYNIGKNGGSEWESNPPVTGNLPPAGFEDRDDHRTACASRRAATDQHGFSWMKRLNANPGHARVRAHRSAATDFSEKTAHRYFGCGTILR